MSTEPLATAPETHRRGFLGFLTTIPGVLTAAAALVTAAGGAYAARHSGAGSDPPHAQPPAAVINLTLSAQAPAPRGGETVASTQALQAVPVRDAQDPAEQLVQNCAAGDDTACARVVEGLVQECQDGSGLSCDVLYELSDEGSDYETYGGTCGYRYNTMVNAGSCQEL
jgi:hypothetical protein